MHAHASLLPLRLLPGPTFPPEMFLSRSPGSLQRGWLPSCPSSQPPSWPSLPAYPLPLPSPLWTRVPALSPGDRYLEDTHSQRCVLLQPAVLAGGLGGLPGQAVFVPPAAQVLMDRQTDWEQDEEPKDPQTTASSPFLYPQFTHLMHMALEWPWEGEVKNWPSPSRSLAPLPPLLPALLYPPPPRRLPPPGLALGPPPSPLLHPQSQPHLPHLLELGLRIDLELTESTVERGPGPLPAPADPRHSLGLVSSSSPGHCVAPAPAGSAPLTFHHPPVLGSWRKERRQLASTKEGLQGPRRPPPNQVLPAVLISCQHPPRKALLLSNRHYREDLKCPPSHS